MTPVLEIQNLTKSFGGILAVQNLTFQVNAGEIFGIIGPNGAGKTTVFNLVSGVYKPTEGEISFKGEDITALSPDKIVKLGITRTFQNIRLFKNLSSIENVVTALDLHNPLYNLVEGLFFNLPFIDSKVKRSEKELREKAMYYLDLVGIASEAYKRADSLPYGLQRKLEIARALALKPELLLLDEPAAGMNPEESMQLARLIKEIQTKLDLTVILIEHHMDLVMEICDNLYVLNFGQELSKGTPDQVQADPNVLKAYLGEGYKRA